MPGKQSVLAGLLNLALVARDVSRNKDVEHSRKLCRLHQEITPILSHTQNLKTIKCQPGGFNVHNVRKDFPG
ncbi:hypothetical protein M8J75_008781 [Diaphorina citri]|nr:hypothetical protein M8J75_008781 [Diaphorina citri]